MNIPMHRHLVVLQKCFRYLSYFSGYVYVFLYIYAIVKLIIIVAGILAEIAVRGIGYTLSFTVCKGFYSILELVWLNKLVVDRYC